MIYYRCGIHDHRDTLAVLDVYVIVRLRNTSSNQVSAH